MSDVDAVLTIAAFDSGRLHVERLIRVGVPGLNLRVSIHGADYEDHLTLSDARLMALVTLAQSRSTDALYLSQYLESKATLSLLRNSSTEGYREIARRVGDPEVVKLFGMKIGVLDEVDRGTSLRVLGKHVDKSDETADIARRLLTRGLDGTIATRVLDLIDEAYRNVPWLRDYLAAKMLAVASRPGGNWFRVQT